MSALRYVVLPTSAQDNASINQKSVRKNHKKPLSLRFLRVLLKGHIIMTVHQMIPSPPSYIIQLSPILYEGNNDLCFSLVLQLQLRFLDVFLGRMLPQPS